MAFGLTRFRISKVSAALLYFVVSLSPTAYAAESPSADLSSPTGGWRYRGMASWKDEARVAYPTPPIDRGAQSGRSLIEGQLRNLQEQRQPHTLAVNGNPLPLYVGDDGRFVRPYAFGSGSNSVAVLSADGQSLKRVQFYEANTNVTPVRIRVILGWDDPKAEVDLHVLTPDGQHAFWAHPVLSNSGGLDTDSVDGPGPEVYTMTAPLKGAYAVYVNYWGNYGNEGYNFNEDSNQNALIITRITLVFEENTVNEKRETFMVPLRAIGELQLIKAFRY